MPAESRQISYEDLQVVARAGVTDLLKVKAGQIDQSRPVIMTMTIASNGQYTVKDLEAYLDVLSQFRNFTTVVFLDCHSACNFDPLSRGIGVQN